MYNSIILAIQNHKKFKFIFRKINIQMSSLQTIVAGILDKFLIFYKKNVNILNTNSNKQNRMFIT